MSQADITRRHVGDRAMGWDIQRLRSSEAPSDFHRLMLIGHSGAGKSRLARLLNVDRVVCDWDHFVRSSGNSSRSYQEVFDIFLKAQDGVFCIAPTSLPFLAEIEGRRSAGQLDDVAIVYLSRSADTVRANLGITNEDGHEHPKLVNFADYYATYDAAFRRVADYVLNVDSQDMDGLARSILGGFLTLTSQNDHAWINRIRVVNEFQEYLEAIGERVLEPSRPVLAPEEMKRLTAGGYQVFDLETFPPEPTTNSIAHAKLADLSWASNHFDGRSVVELGSQLGFFSFHVAGLGACQVLGIDLNRNFVREANRIAALFESRGELPPATVMFQTGELQVGSSFAPRPDIVIASSVVHWFIIQNPGITLGEVLRWLHDMCAYAVYFEGCVSADEDIMRQHGVQLERFNEDLFLATCARTFRSVEFVGRCSYNDRRIVARLYK